MKSKIIAGMVAASVLTIGAGTAAFASSSAPASPPSTATKCANAPARLARLEAADKKVQARIAALQQKSGPRVQARIEKAKDREAKIEARMSRIEKRCPAGTPAS